MKPQTFALQPFAPGLPAPPYTITGTISQASDRTEPHLPSGRAAPGSGHCAPGRNAGPPVAVVGNHLL